MIHSKHNSHGGGGGAEVAHSDKCPTLHYDSGHDLRVVRSSLAHGALHSAWSQLESLPLPLPLHPPMSASLFKINTFSKQNKTHNDTERLKTKGWEKKPLKTAGVAVQVSDQLFLR